MFKKDKYGNEGQEVPRKPDILLIENITKGLTEEIKKELKIRKKELDIKIELKEGEKDLVRDLIVNRINKKMMNLEINSKCVFSFFMKDNVFQNNNENIVKLYPIIYNEFIILKYNDFHYHIENIKANQKANLVYKLKVLSFLYDLFTGDLLILSEELKISRVILSKGKTCTLHKQINIDKVLLNESKIQFKNASYYNFNNDNTILISKAKILFFDNNLNLKSMVDITFAFLPFPLLFDNIPCFISNENCIYKLTPSYSNNNNSFSLFSDISLSFTNEKYKELTDLFRIVVCFAINREKQKFSNLKNDKKLKKLFEEYDLNSYVENLSQVINKENVIFFINYNLSSSKFQNVILYCIINDKIDLLRKIGDLLKSSKSISNYILYREFVLEFISDFIEDISIEDKSLSKQISINI